MKQHRLVAGFLFAISLLLGSHTLFAQFNLERYLSQDEIDLATQTAKDSIGSDAILVAIASPGEIDLNEIGFPLVEKGYDTDDGTSAVWGYLFMTPSGDDSIGVAIAKFPLLDPFVVAEKGEGFDQEPIALDLSGINSGSDAFAALLKTNAIFNQYMQDYPDAIPDAAVLARRPEGAAELLPPNFPVDKPIWSIFYGGDELNDSAMVCYASSGGDSEVFCYRFDEASSVSTNGNAQGDLSLSVTPNPVSGGDQVTFRLQAKHGAHIDAAGLYDLNGKEIRSLDQELQRSGDNEYIVTVNTSDLPSGQYFCRVVMGENVHAVSLIVE